MGLLSLLLLGACALGGMAYIPSMKDGPTLNEVFLQEVVDRMGRDLDNYLDDVNSDSLLYPQLMSRSYKDVDYQDNPIPRDQEYLHHSTLWANRYINDGK
ncbi:Neuroendocrine protein [Nesidiocoris tenuis]|uniref:Neuroendocrine protein n=1 Tax=Nesidiocoris tenuis TaxID=355587 RepID=A0ABN7ARF6_9HEMI|nr:Neuroendocrine protein [Nesidiocoris tenuis]